MIEQQEVLDFWFKELKPAQHFKKDPTVDAEIARRFASQHQNAASGKLACWRATADGRLAEIGTVGWRQLAKRFNKKWVHLPLSRFSDSTVQQLRMVHVLNGKDIRSYAADFIRKA